MIAKIIVDIPNKNVDKTFDYKIPSEFCVCVGCRVKVNFANRFVEGYVIDIINESNYDETKLKDIVSIVDNQPIILPELMNLVDYLTAKNNLRKIDVIRLLLPSGMRSGKVKILTRKFVTLSNNINIDVARKEIGKRAKSQLAILDKLLGEGKIGFTELSNLFNSSSIKKLQNDGYIVIIEEKQRRIPNSNNKQDKKIKLTDYQQRAVSQILEKKGVNLLFGVTGSGKTEVYMHTINKVLDEGKNAIMLVPEISLTPQMLSSFKARFGDSVAVLHSGLSEGEKFDEWKRIFDGEARIVLGARSAIFAPIKDLGVIVIDEEHDSSYQSDSNPRYDTIEVARWRSEFYNCPLVLGSATPKIEDYYLATKGVYNLIELPNRVNNKPMPQIKVVDMFNDLMQDNFSSISSYLETQLRECINRGEQALVFLNRRGYVSFKRCVKCGYTPKCLDCDKELVYHKEDNQLKCHFCDRRYKSINICPKCGGLMEREGATGTQKVVDELKVLFPNIPIFRMDNDTTKNKDAYLRILEEFEKTYPSILVGTQMIAKGHDFPLITCVGIVNADMALHQSDYHATEKCFQLVTQVSGRAGRDEREGEVILQTYKPKSYVYQFACSYDYQGFYSREIALRETSHFPPFATIIRILFTSELESDIISTIKNVWEKILQLKENYNSDFIYSKAMACPIKRIKNKFRYQIMIRIKRNQNLENIMNEIYNIVNQTNAKKVLIFTEINPESLS